MPGTPPTAAPWEPHQPPGHTSVQRDSLSCHPAMLVPSGSRTRLEAVLGQQLLLLAP